MPTPFANTLRSLNADRFHASLIGLGVALVLLIAWGCWFFLARMTMYEVSASALVAGDGFVIADFAAAKPGRIRRGQAAWLYPVRDGGKQAGSVPAVVIDIISSPLAEPARVKLFPVLDRDLSKLLPEGQKVRVEIEVESVSPAVLVLRTSGLLVDTPGVALSPQPQRGR
jgi:hypothetical protein